MCALTETLQEFYKLHPVNCLGRPILHAWPDRKEIGLFKSFHARL